MVKSIEQLLSENAALQQRVRNLELECQGLTLLVHQVAKGAQRLSAAAWQGESLAELAELERAIASGPEDCRNEVKASAWRELVNMIEWQPARHQAEQARQRLEFDQQISKTDKRAGHESQL